MSRESVVPLRASMRDQRVQDDFQALMKCTDIASFAEVVLNSGISRARPERHRGPTHA